MSKKKDKILVSSFVECETDG